MGNVAAVFASEEQAPDDLYRKVLERGQCERTGSRRNLTLDCDRLGGHEGDHWDGYVGRYWREQPESIVEAIGDPEAVSA